MYQSFEDRLNQIIPRLTSRDFLDNRGLGNEIGFWIFDYPPERELEVRAFLHEVVLPALAKRQPVLNVANINLFDLIISVLEDRKLLDKAIDMQQRKGDEAVMASLRPVLKEDKLARNLAEKIDLPKLDMLILSGVGAAYPLLRTHNLLSALQSMMEDTTLLMLYPGRYDGHSFRLFNKLPEDHYYRAFQLVI